MVLLREIEVENIIRKFLQENGFTVTPRPRPRPKPTGVDIIARKNNVQYYIEVKETKDLMEKLL